MEYMIPSCSGKRIDVKQGQTITVIDLEGGQVVDFFAEATGNQGEFLSTGVTIDCNESLGLNAGDKIYTNLYHPMMQVISDDVGEHDLLHPCCRPEMYDFFYHNGEGHPNCLDNINGALGENRLIRRHTVRSLVYRQQCHPSGQRCYLRIRRDSISHDTGCHRR